MSNTDNLIKSAVTEGVAIGLEYAIFQMDTFSAATARKNTKEFLTKKQKEVEDIKNEITGNIGVSAEG